MLDIATRRRICEDTIARSHDIATSTPGGSPSSHFIAEQLPPLSSSSLTFPNFPASATQILDTDAFAIARILVTSLPSGTGNASSASASPKAAQCRKVGVLNLASDEVPGGGWRLTLTSTQEECLCYSSTLYATLNPACYPWPNLGPGSTAGIFSPSVVVFRDTFDNDLAELAHTERFVVAVMTVAAPMNPQLTEDGEGFRNEADLGDLREKVRLVLRMAAGNSVTDLVLGAMGCGAYRCPPTLVAREMKAVLAESEFTGWFAKVVFAVYARGPEGRKNLLAFSREFATDARRKSH